MTTRIKKKDPTRTRTLSKRAHSERVTPATSMSRRARVARGSQTPVNVKESSEVGRSRHTLGRGYAGFIQIGSGYLGRLRKGLSRIRRPGMAKAKISTERMTTSENKRAKSR